jgi:protein phosphatase
MKLGDHYRVEGLVRLAEGRMFYLLNDDRPDRDFRTCFDCGFQENPREARACLQCGGSMMERKFLMSVRWDPTWYAPYLELQRRALKHPGVRWPSDIFIQDDLLCSVVPYQSESLLLDECAPLTDDELLRFAQWITGTSAFLMHRGVRLNRLVPGNFLLTAENELRFYDLDIASVQDAPIPSPEQGEMVQQVVALLRRFVAVDCEPFWGFVEQAESGAFPDIPSFGEALQALFPRLSGARGAFPAAALSDVGLCRDLNEDNWAWAQLAPTIDLFVVADGMGGHACGEVASELATRTICRVARDRLVTSPELTVEVLENILDEAFQAANNTVKEIAERRGNDMGTTLVALLLIDRHLALIANVGDSRGYLLRDKALHQVTRDHSLVARMVEQNRITPEEARNHPHSNILLRTVGTERNVEIDIFSVEIEKGDRILLCSDGLWGEVDDEDIEAILNHYQDQRVITRELIRAAHHGGGKDNITLILVDNDGARLGR